MRGSRPASRIAAVVALAALLVLSLQATTAADGGHGRQATYEVTVTNLTDAQYLTPPNWAGHTRAADVFSLRKPASAAVQGVAENGDVPGLAAALASAVDDAGHGVSGVGADAPIGPGASASFSFTTTADRFSLVAMLICTNDGFAGLDAKALPGADGQTRTYYAQAYDAGTEINTELRADLVPAPFCGDGPGSGASNPLLAENGVIQRHRTLQGVGDIDPALDWRGPVAKVEITRTDVVPTYSIRIENPTTGQYLTPPNFALHDRSVDLFRPGRPASPELAQLAENGDVPGMAAAIAAAVDAGGHGVSGVAPTDPIGPGGSVEFEVTADATRLSIVSMVICTNDGFAGLDDKSLPRAAGETRTYVVRAWDAGSEVNTELRADLVPAPFCGDGPGSGASNPLLAENGVIRPHRTLLGVGDLDPALDWDGPVMIVTVTRN